MRGLPSGEASRQGWQFLRPKTTCGVPPAIFLFLLVSIIHHMSLRLDDRRNGRRKGKKNGRSEAFRTVEPRIPAIFPLGILEVLPSRLRPAELQGLPRVHEGFQLPCSPPTVPPGPGEHVKLAEIREREPKGKSLGWRAPPLTTHQEAPQPSEPPRRFPSTVGFLWWVVVEVARAPLTPHPLLGIACLMVKPRTTVSIRYRQAGGEG